MVHRRGKDPEQKGKKPFGMGLAIFQTNHQMLKWGKYLFEVRKK